MVDSAEGYPPKTVVGVFDEGEVAVSSLEDESGQELLISQRQEAEVRKGLPPEGLRPMEFLLRREKAIKDLRKRRKALRRQFKRYSRANRKRMRRSMEKRRKSIRNKRRGGRRRINQEKTGYQKRREERQNRLNRGRNRNRNSRN